MQEPLDHRDLNRDLAIFATDALAGAGLPLWLPDGAVIREELQALAKEIARADGCQSVFTPVLGKRALFERSGHLAKFSDDMFPPMVVGGDELMLRPANCPHHALAYGVRRHSYRELPIRFNELGAMFRAERSGVLSGLSRVRQISLDDTHVFCRPDQVDDEVARALRSALRAQEILGLPVDHIRLSRRGDGPGYLGSPEDWHVAEEALRRLEPLLTASPSGRVVLVANAGAYRDLLDLDDPHYRRGRPGMRVASRTQFANDLLAVELSERYRGTSVAATCVFPGVVRTNVFRNGVGVPRPLAAVLAAVAARVGLPPAEAAETPAWLADSADAAAMSASFFGPRRAVRRIPDRVRRPERRRALWDLSEQLAAPWLAGMPADR